MRLLILFFNISFFLILPSCSGEENNPDYLDITDDLEILFNKEGGSEAIEFNSSSEWSVTNIPPWIRVNSDKGNGGKSKIIFTAENNNSYDSRTAKIQISNKTITKKINISQYQKDLMELSEKSIYIDESGGKITINIRTNIEYNIIIPSPWIKKSNTKSLNSKEEQFSIDVYTGIEKREGKIIFASKSSTLVDTIIVIQNRTGIYTAEHFKTFAEEMTKDPKKRSKEILLQFGKYDVNTNQWTFSLKKDIDLNPKIKFKDDGTLPEGIKPDEWIPVGYNIDGSKVTFYTFDDIFEGNSYSISGIYINQTYRSFQALFYKIGDKGKINNLTLQSGLVKGKENIGGIASSNAGVIYKCINRAVIIAENGAGGICFGNSGNIDTSMNYGYITSSQHGSSVGGISGYSSGSEKTQILNCCNYGSINGGYYVGGISGSSTLTRIENCTNFSSEIQGSLVGGISGSAGNIYNCKNSGNIINSLGFLGGIVGSGKHVTNSTNKGNLVGSGYTGGIVAIASGTDVKIEACSNEGDILCKESPSPGARTYSGGIIAELDNSLIKKTALIIACYNSGKVSSKYTSASSWRTGNGGIAGMAAYTTVVSSYNVGILEGYAFVVNEGLNAQNTYFSCFFLDTCGAIALYPGSSDLGKQTNTQLVNIANDLNKGIKQWNDLTIENPSFRSDYLFDKTTKYPQIRK